MNLSFRFLTMFIFACFVAILLLPPEIMSHRIQFRLCLLACLPFLLLMFFTWRGLVSTFDCIIDTATTLALVTTFDDRNLFCHRSAIVTRPQLPTYSSLSPIVNHFPDPTKGFFFSPAWWHGGSLDAHCYCHGMVQTDLVSFVDSGALCSFSPRVGLTTVSSSTTWTGWNRVWNLDAEDSRIKGRVHRRR